MRRERRRTAYIITACISLAVGYLFIWKLDYFSLPMRVVFILLLMVWLQITVWFSVRRRRHGTSSSRSEKYI